MVAACSAVCSCCPFVPSQTGAVLANSVSCVQARLQSSAGAARLVYVIDGIPCIPKIYSACKHRPALIYTHLTDGAGHRALTRRSLDMGRRHRNNVCELYKDIPYSGCMSMQADTNFTYACTRLLQLPVACTQAASTRRNVVDVQQGSICPEHAGQAAAACCVICTKARSLASIGNGILELWLHSGKAIDIHLFHCDTLVVYEGSIFES